MLSSTLFWVDSRSLDHLFWSVRLLLLLLPTLCLVLIQVCTCVCR